MKRLENAQYFAFNRNFKRVINIKPIYGLLSLIFLVFNLCNSVQAQNFGCAYDDLFDTNMNNGSRFSIEFEENEQHIIEMFNDGQMMALLSSSSSYNIPVVVHVMHKGEAIGVGSNISDAQINQALQDLNNAFANTNGNGVDCDITYCLAERDADGNASSGIERVNAASICAGGFCYGPSGITVGGLLETAVKAASYYPSQDYLNIWVVHEVQGSPAGYAYSCGNNEFLDGIVIEDDIFGVSGSGVLLHETGHFWGLFHTFEGDCPAGVNCNTNCTTGTICPPNTPCNNDPNDNSTEVCCRTQGDRICDTPPHKRTCGGCNQSGTNSCDGGSLNSLFVSNYMNYSDPTCINQFTDGQRTRMRMNLMGCRSSLMESFGCFPPCPSIDIAFLVPFSHIADIDVPITFINITSGETSNEWTIDGAIESTSDDLTFTFTTPGKFRVCLTASNNTCDDRLCKDIYVLGNDPCHEPLDTTRCGNAILINPNFESILPLTQYKHLPSAPTYDFTYICNWFNREGSPELLADQTADNNAIVLFTDDLVNESIGTQREINFTHGQSYRISFFYSAYYVSEPNETIDAIRVSLSTDIFDTTTDTPIHNELNILFRGQELIKPFFDAEVLDSITFCFVYDELMGKYLNIKPISDGGNSFIKIENIEITCCPGVPPCDPDPIITVVPTQDSCKFNFIASNPGDPGTSIWYFGDGTQMSGDSVCHEFLFGTEVSACLSISCSEYITETVCVDITLPESCTDCIVLPNINAVQCDTSSAYMAKIEFDIPKGTKPCVDDELFVYSEDVFMNPSSVHITNIDANTDRFTGCFDITPYAGYDFETNGATGYISLCDSLGIESCFEFNVNATACDACAQLTIEDYAFCIDSLSTDSVFVFGDSLIISGLPQLAQTCEETSEEAGFTMTQTPLGNGEWQIDYQVSTTTNVGFDFSTLICFEVGLKKYCGMLDITVPEPCDTEDLPTICEENWATKDMDCTRLEGESLVYEFDMSVDIFGYEVCDEGLFGTVDGGVVLDVRYRQNGRSLTFDLEMHMPCDMDLSKKYNLRIYLCDSQGNLICYKFPFLFDCDLDCDDVIKSRSVEDDLLLQSLLIYPNPTRDILIVESDYKDKDLSVQVIDHVGREISTRPLTESRTTIFTESYQSGLYLIRLSDKHGNQIALEKVLVIK